MAMIADFLPIASACTWTSPLKGNHYKQLTLTMIDHTVKHYDNNHDVQYDDDDHDHDQNDGHADAHNDDDDDCCDDQMIAVMIRRLL